MDCPSFRTPGVRQWLINNYPCFANGGGTAESRILPSMTDEAETQTLETETVDHAALRERLGMHLYRQRINIQTYHAAQKVGQGQTLFHPENIPLLRLILQVLLKGSLLWSLGRRNARAIQVREVHVNLRRLPEAFRGFRILQLSDLHLDLDAELTEAILARVEGLEYDLCVLTGDYRAETHGNRLPAAAEIRRLLPRLKPRLGKEAVLAVLGNHDDIEFAAHLEAAGARVLLNEAVPVEVDGAEIFVAGVDDPHFYETDSLERATGDIPPEATKILLCHTAEPYRRALVCGIDYMLCGHTHGGQICLPGGIALLRNARHPAAMTRGPWRCHELRGYTSAGTGCSMVPVRFFCPAEVTIHVLGREAPGTGD